MQDDLEVVHDSAVLVSIGRGCLARPSHYPRISLLTGQAPHEKCQREIGADADDLATAAKCPVRTQSVWPPMQAVSTTGSHGDSWETTFFSCLGVL